VFLLQRSASTVRDSDVLVKQILFSEWQLRIGPQNKAAIQTPAISMGQFTIKELLAYQASASNH
jgi:hypothetical protein